MASKKRSYTISGTLSKVGEQKLDKNGKPFVSTRMTFMERGRQVTKTAIAFGDSATKLAGKLAEGASDKYRIAYRGAILVLIDVVAPQAEAAAA